MSKRVVAAYQLCLDTLDCNMEKVNINNQLRFRLTLQFHLDLIHDDDNSKTDDDDGDDGYIDGDDDDDDTEQFQTFSLKCFFLRCQRLSAGRNEIACGGPIIIFVKIC